MHDSQKSADRQPIVLSRWPDSLLKEDGDISGVLRLIPWADRKQRKIVAKDWWEKQGHHGPLKTPTKDFLLDVFSDPAFRFASFWKSRIDLLKEPDKATDGVFLSPEFYLIHKRPFAEVTFSRFDEIRFSVGCPEWPMIRQRLKAVAAPIRAPELDPLMLWFELDDRLGEWSALGEREKEGLANEIFTVASITGSDWFLRTAIAREPSLRGFYSVMLEGSNLDDAAGPKGNVEVEWDAAWDYIGELANGAVADRVDVRFLDGLDAVQGKLRWLRDEIERIQERGEVVEQKIQELGTILAEMRGVDSCGWLDGKLCEDFLVGWRQFVAGISSKDELDVALAQIERLSVGIGSAFAGYRELVRQLNASRETRQRLEMEMASMAGIEKRRAAQEEIKKTTLQILEMEDRQVKEEERLLRWLVPHFDQHDTSTQGSEQDPAAAYVGEPSDALTLEQRDASGTVGAITEAREDQVSNITASIGSDNHAHAAGLSDSGESHGDDVESPPRGATEASSFPDADIRGREEDNHEPKPEPEPASEPTRKRIGEEPRRPAEETVPLAALSDDPFTQGAGETCRPVWSALRAYRPGLAFQLARLIEAVDSEIKVPPVALLRCVALASEVRGGEGKIAGDLAAAYTQFDEAWFREGPEPWRLALSMLLVAATLRPALLAPSTGASSMLRYQHLGEGSENLFQLSQEVIAAGERLQGLGLSSASFGGARSQAGWQTDLEGLLEEITAWRHQAPHMTMRFAAATYVWQHWQKTGGVIDRLLAPVSANRMDAARTIRDLIGKLSDPSDFRKLVRDTDRKDLKRRRGDDIHADAFSQLVLRTEEAVRFAARWLDLLSVRPDQSDYLDAELGRLREMLSSLVPSARQELQRQAAEARDTWALRGTAALCAERAVERLWDLFATDDREPEDEPNLGHLLSADLLLVPGLSLDADWMPEGDPAAALDALRLVPDRVADWEGAFRARLELGDLEGAERLTQLDLDLALQLENEFSKALVAHQAALERKIDELHKQLELSISYGLVNEAERQEQDAILVDLEQCLPTIRRFHEARGQLERVQAFLGERRNTKTQEAQSRLGEIESNISQSDRDRVKLAIDAGDFLTATEYLERLSVGDALPSEEEVPKDAFVEFFPATAQNIERFLEDTHQPQAVAQKLKDRAMIAGISMQSVAGAHAVQAAEMFNAWSSLKRAQRADGRTLRVVLEALGFVVVELRLEEKLGNRQECSLDTEVLQDRKLCPSSMYGSQARGRYRLVCVWGRPTEEDLLKSIGDSHGGRPAIVFYFGRLTDTRRRRLAQMSRERRRSFLVLDEILLVFLGTERDSRLPTFFQCALPFAYTEPYITTSSLVPPEMFFGRLDELRAVTELNGRCFIYGGRQLGKTALLREAERRFHNPSRHRFARWIDLKAEEIGYSREPEDVWAVLYRVFRDQKLLPADLSEPTPRIRGRVDSFLDWLRNWFVSHPEGRWLILLDEADRFLEQDARREFPVTTRLKNLMEATERRFKVVFAGLHNVLRTTEQANHPLAHLGDPVEIGPLLKSGEWREAQALITQPFGHAGFVFEPADLPVRILAQTNYYPSLIQLYCSQLLKQIQNLQTSTVDFSTGPRYAITEREVDDVYRSRDLREAIRSRIQLTLQLDPRYELIAYTIAYGVLQRTVSLADGLESRAIRERALRWWPEGFKGTGDHEFLVILEEMTGLGVLRDCGNRRFSLRNANVALLMGTIEEVEMVLLRDREPPQEFEPAVFRARVVGSLDSLARSPLTASQEAQLSGPENGVSVILGTRLGGIDDVLPYLQARYLGEFTRVLGHPREGGTFKEILQESLERRSAFGTTLFVVPAGMPWDGGWLADAVQVTNQLRSEAKFARIIFLCDAVTFQNRFWEIRQAEDMGCRVMALRPWDDSFLRQWLEDNGLQSVPEARAAIKEATGNWPRILYEYGMASRADHRLEANPGEWLSGYLTEAIASELRRELGLDTGVCHAILGLLAELGEATTGELEEFAADENIDAEIVPTTLEWAERLHLAWRSGTEAWRLDPMIRRLFSAALA